MNLTADCMGLTSVITDAVHADISIQFATTAREAGRSGAVRVTKFSFASALAIAYV